MEMTNEHDHDDIETRYGARACIVITTVKIFFKDTDFI